MRVLGAIILAVLVLLALFVALNWGALTAPTTLSFAVASVDAPLGVILTGFALLFAAGLRAGIRESGERNAALTKGIEVAIRQSLEEATNSLAACIGQIDDKLNRQP